MPTDAEGLPFKIVTAPTKLTVRQRMVRDTEIKIQRVYALGDTLTLRQRSQIVRSLLDRLLVTAKTNLVEFDRSVQ